jgi:protein-disulfide isomerase
MRRAISDSKMIRTLRSLDRTTALIGLVAVVGLVAAIGRLTGTLSDGRHEPENVTGSADIYNYYGTGLLDGPHNAPVTLLVYSDFACSYCRQLHATLDSLRLRYPQHLAVVWKNIDRSDDHTLLPTLMGAQCAALQGSFRSYQAASFANPQLASDHAGWLKLAAIAAVPRQDSLSTCIKDQRFRGRVESDLREADLLNILYTPTFFVHRRRVEGAPPLAVVDSLIALVLRNSLAAIPGPL